MKIHSIKVYSILLPLGACGVQDADVSDLSQVTKNSSDKIAAKISSITVAPGFSNAVTKRLRDFHSLVPQFFRNHQPAQNA